MYALQKCTSSCMPGARPCTDGVRHVPTPSTIDRYYLEIRASSSRGAHTRPKDGAARARKRCTTIDDDDDDRARRGCTKDVLDVSFLRELLPRWHVPTPLTVPATGHRDRPRCVQNAQKSTIENRNRITVNRNVEKEQQRVKSEKRCHAVSTDIHRPPSAVRVRACAKRQRRAKARSGRCTKRFVLAKKYRRREWTRRQATQQRLRCTKSMYQQNGRVHNDDDVPKDVYVR